MASFNLGVGSSGATITGDKEIDRKLKKLAKSGQKKAARSGISKAMTVLSRGIRNAIPPNYKSVKKTVGRKYGKNKKTFQHEAKVGLGVGKKTKSKKQRDPRKPGVGISKNNVHWLILGTKNRTRDKGGPTGRMPAVGQGWVQQGVKSVESEAIRAMQEQMQKKVLEEVAKA